MTTTMNKPAEIPGGDEATYLYYRAEEQLQLAQSATHPAAVRAHYLMADHYLENAYKTDEERQIEGAE
jgi:hypothetical protein